LAAYLWCEPAAGEAERKLEGLNLHAPVLLKYEIANVARSKLRSGASLAAARSGVDALAEQRLVFHDVDPVELLELGARHELTAYDAAYLALAARLAAPLLTFDRRLAEAAARHFGKAT
jgi:predicted nucleic acid-binding protein